MFGYSATSAFPTSSFLATNYYVDPVFVAAAADSVAPTVITTLPAAGATGVSTIQAVTATYSEPVQPATVSFVLKGPGNVTVPAVVTYIPASRTSRLAPTSPLAVSTTYNATVTGATDSAGNPMSAPVTWSFTTSATGPPPQHQLWDDSVVPVHPADADPTAVELGVKFQSDVSGVVSGVRFYKGDGNIGTHTGSLWTVDGTLLATATFTNRARPDGRK